MKVYCWLAAELCWTVGNGRQIAVGVDPILCVSTDQVISTGLLSSLRSVGCYTLNSIHIQTSRAYWSNADELRLPPLYAAEWNNYIHTLNCAGIRLNCGGDQVLWAGNAATGIVTAKTAYSYMIKRRCILPMHWWYKAIWSWNIPLKMKCFLWVLLQDRLKSWDNLSLLGWIGPSQCSLCLQEFESASHIFINCSFTQSLWVKFYQCFGLTLAWEGINVESCLHHWVNCSNAHPTLLVFVCWSL